MARLDSFLRLVAEQHASDLHLRAGHVPMVRYCGELTQLPFRTLSQEEAVRLLAEVMTPEQSVTFAKEQEIDFAYELPGIGRFRAHAFHYAHGVAAVFRIVPGKAPTIEGLRLPASLKELALVRNGLVLVTGPTGSGKSTTLAAMVHEINKTTARHIITIEDPIEFVHEPLQSLVTQRQVGVHVASFAAGLRSALRESPDVLVIGEMRDLETISLALAAAETGTLVFGTLHTRSAARAIDRILDTCTEETRDQVTTTLSVVLKGVVAQYLCRHKSGDYLLPAVEVLLQTHAVSNMIRENKLHQVESFLQGPELRGTGMQSFDTCVLGYLDQGLITVEEAQRLASGADAQRRIATFAARVD
jgi:twitching motility protein PilT